LLLVGCDFLDEHYIDSLKMVCHTFRDHFYLKCRAVWCFGCVKKCVVRRLVSTLSPIIDEIELVCYCLVYDFMIESHMYGGGVRIKKYL
jgi:hypothetical protein